jgi:hypothetical protein
MTDQPEQYRRVRIVNCNPFPIHDRQDGIPYSFLPDKPVDVPPEVAEHIFGFPGDIEDMHRHMAKRWGWNQPQHQEWGEDGLMVWQRMCARISVSVERYELRRVTDPKAPIPAEEAGDAQIFDPRPVGGPAEDAPTTTRVGYGKRKAKGWPKGKKRGPARKAQLGGQKPAQSDTILEIPDANLTIAGEQ